MNIKKKTSKYHEKLKVNLPEGTTFEDVLKKMLNTKPITNKQILEEAKSKKKKG